MNIDTGEPLDTLLPDTKTWLKSIGSKATTLSNIIETRDPLVRVFFSPIKNFLNIINVNNFFLLFIGV